MEQTHGTWGNRTRIFRWDGGLVTYLDLVPNKRCSYHSHKYAFNQFFVVSGCLGVKTAKGYTTKMTKGQAFTVEPGIKHEFQTYNDPTEVVEIAFVRYDESDIDRELLGGDLYKLWKPDNDKKDSV